MTDGTAGDDPAQPRASRAEAAAVPAPAAGPGPWREGARLSLQVVAVLGLYLATRRAWGSLTRLPESVFDGPFLLSRALGTRSVIAAVVGALLLAIVGVLRERRQPPLTHPRALRGLIASLIVAQAWTLVFGEVNLYTDRAYVADRLLLGAVAVVAIRSMWWAPLFLSFSLVLMAQATAGIDALCWTDMRLLLDAQILLAAFLIVRATLGADTRVFVFTLLLVAAGSYVGPALDKLALGATPLDWALEDDLGNIVVSAWLGGWLSSVSASTVIGVAQAATRLSPALCIATLVIELGPVLSPVRGRIAAACLLGAVLLHTMIFALTGILFWKWIVVDVALAVVCWRFGRELVDSVPVLVRLAAVALLCAAQPVLAPQHLGWWDTRVTQAFVIDVVDEQGVVRAFPPLAFAPYDVDFAQSRFFFLGGPAKKTGTFGATNRQALFRQLQDARTPGDVAALFPAAPALRDERAAARFEAFLRRFFEHLNARGGARPFTPHVPAHIQVRRPPPTWSGERVVEVQVRLLETLYDGASLVPLGDTIVSRVLVPRARSDRRTLLPPGRALPATPSTRTPTLGCDREPALTVAFLGDVLIYRPLHQQVVRDGYASLWPNTQPLVAGADIAWANLETTLGCCTDADGNEHPDPGTAFDDLVYTGNDKTGLNTRADLATALQQAGVDLVSTANNHSMDRGLVGLRRTLDILDEAGLAHSGSRRSTDEPWHAVVERGGWKIAFLACTEWTNRKTELSRPLLLDCTEDRELVFDEIRKLALAYDAVVFTPHGGLENRVLPDSRLRSLVEGAADAGATVVATSHPHNTQTWERRSTPDGRDVPLLWGRGNTLTTARSLEARASTLAFVELVRGANGRLAAGPVAHVPTAIVIDGGRRTLRPSVGVGGDEPALQLVRERWGMDAELPPEAPVRPRALCAPHARPASAAALGHACTGVIACTAPLTCEEVHDGEGVCTAPCAGDDACGAGHCVDGRCRAGCGSDADCALATLCARGACVPGEPG